VCGLEHQRHLLNENTLVVHRLEAVRKCVDLRAVNPTPIGKALEADQERITGKG